MILGNRFYSFTGVVCYSCHVGYDDERKFQHAAGSASY